MHLTDDAKWKAVEICDETYDGVFFVCVKTTGIFCRPSCKARTPYRKNITFCDTAEEALQAGFRACKRCRPDLIEYKPVEEVADKLKALIDKQFQEHVDLAVYAAQLGVSTNHLHGVFKKYYAVTPFEYRNRLRTEKALTLLQNTNQSITQIAFTCGFESTSSFYRIFKKHTGNTPREYRAIALSGGTQ